MPTVRAKKAASEKLRRAADFIYAYVEIDEITGLVKRSSYGDSEAWSILIGLAKSP